MYANYYRALSTFPLCKPTDNINILSIFNDNPSSVKRMTKNSRSLRLNTRPIQFLAKTKGIIGHLDFQQIELPEGGG